jgi:acyl transferase domain-containing protein
MDVKPNRAVVFMFPGQGSQHVCMGRDLYQNELLFHEQVDTCAELLRPRLGLDMREVLYPNETNAEKAAEQMEQTWLAQLALFTIEYALAQLWMAWGVKPAAMIGHDIGEYVAACLAGVFDLEDALTLVAARAQLMQSTPSGSMLSVPLAEDVQPRQMHLHEPQIPYISNVTGTWVTPQEATDPVYWAQHLHRAARFSDGMSVLAQMPERVLLEVGPGHTLAQHHPDRTSGQVVLPSMRHPQDAEDDDAFLLGTLGQLWLTGIPIDWPAFYQDERRLRVRLPTYPFDRREYWVEPRKGDADYNRPGSLFKNPDITRWFYIPSWKHTMPPIRERQEPEACWLLFGDQESFSNKLTQWLQTRGYKVATVFAGEQFTADGDTYTVRLAHADDYKALLTTLDERGQSPSHIVHLWNMAPLDSSVPNFTDRALERSFYSLLVLAQAIGSQDRSGNLQLAIISSNMQQIVSGEVVHPEKAALLGLCKVIRQEMPSVTARSIDVALPETGSENETQLIEQIIAELETNTADSIIAYRGNDRLIQTYEPAPLAEISEALDHKLHEGGVYLITGGLGGIGLTLAEHLAQTMHAKLVLTSRSHFPDREAWEQWLATHEPQDRISLCIGTVQALEAAGAEVLVVQADVANRNQMEDAVHAACTRFGAIHGVIHAAGVPGGGVIQLKTEESAADVLRPKIYGTRVLETVLRDVPLDFMVLCSSVAATLGGIGQVDYCAANAFMDAFAHASSGHNGRVISINWDTWATVGMAVNTAANYTGRRLQPTFQTTPVDHPLLTSSYRETGERTVYQAELSPSKDWVLAEHLIMGIPTVPGTTHLELARAAFADATKSDRLEIRDAMFFTPLMVGRGDSKETRLVLEKSADGFEFQVRSKAGITAGGEAQWETHAMGHLGPVADTPQQYDLEAVRARCNVSEVAVAAESMKYAGFMTFGPRWFNTPKRINIGHDEVLVQLELNGEFISDLEGFKLHPALLDIAASTGVMLLNSERPYLPLSYKQMRTYGDLPAKIYSYVRLKPDSVTDGETVTFQVTLLDERGCCVVEIEEFTMKQVRETAAVHLRESADIGTTRARESKPTASESNQRDLSNAILPEEGVEAFRRIVSRNRLPQIAVVTRHLPTLIRQANDITRERMLEEATRAKAGQEKHPRPNLQTAYTAPQNEIEEKIAAVWQDLLGIEQVGIHDSFFDLGGDSLLMAGVYSRLQNVLDQNFLMVDLFKFPTVSSLAEHLSQTQAEKPTPERFQARGRKYRAALEQQRQQRD